VISAATIYRQVVPRRHRSAIVRQRHRRRRGCAKHRRRHAAAAVVGGVVHADRCHLLHASWKHLGNIYYHRVATSNCINAARKDETAAVAVTGKTVQLYSTQKNNTEKILLRNKKLKHVNISLFSNLFSHNTLLKIVVNRITAFLYVARFCRVGAAERCMACCRRCVLFRTQRKIRKFLIYSLTMNSRWLNSMYCHFNINIISGEFDRRPIETYRISQ